MATLNSRTGYFGAVSGYLMAISMPAILPHNSLTMRDALPTETQTNDRRRNPRFSCAGPARILHLPSDGTLLTGFLRNLSLGGCYVETVSPLPSGARAEILLRVNAASLRAAGRVSITHNHCGMGIEFLHLSSTGQSMLLDLLRDLARINSQMQLARALRREAQDAMLHKSLGPLVLVDPVLATADLSARSQEASSQLPDNTLDPAIWLDLFA
jgi:hypothetical protein